MGLNEAVSATLPLVTASFSLGHRGGLKLLPYPKSLYNKMKNVGNCKGLGRGLRLLDIDIKGWLRDAHHLADLLHRQPLLLVKLYGPLLFTCWQRLGVSAQAASDPGGPKSRLCALLDQLPFEFCQVVFQMS